MAKYAVNKLGGRFVISVATDRREVSGDYSISYVLSFDKQKTFLVLHSHVPADDSRIQSITPDVPAANWSEREARDMVGVESVGHPDPRRLVLPDDFLLLLVSDGLLELMPQKSNRERFKDLLSRVTGPDVTFDELTEGLGVEGAQQLPDDVALLSVVRRDGHG